tara:strand:+ start:92 stop:418 length:327 start_codon:yes stop_codon:yes gene_type:complete
MGDLVVGLCKCGFKTDDIYLGVGMMGGSGDAICYCDDCESIQSLPTYNSPKLCGKCNKILNTYIKAIDEYEEKEIDLIDGDDGSKGTYYHCPKCKKKSLLFQWTGIWD